MAPPSHVDLPGALSAVRSALEGAGFALATPSADAARRDARAVLEQLDDYLLPRLARLDAPLVAVVGGSTGAGKSTLVNALVGEEVTTTGVLRPTTRRPVLVCSPADAGWFDGGGPVQLLPALSRASDGDARHGDTPGGDTPDGSPSFALRVTATLPPGLALLDAPDVDSVVAENRELAARLLAAADLWVFVTTAGRYADAVPWSLLRDARDRGAAVLVVLDRLPPGAADEVSAHLRSMLADEGLGDVEVRTVPEVTLPAGSLLPDDVVGPLRDRLAALAAAGAEHDAVVRRTLLGALAALSPRLERLTEAAEEQRAAAERLRAAAEGAYGAATEEVAAALGDGSVLRGEVLARWSELVGAPDLARTLQGRVGRVRDRVTAAIAGRPAPDAPERLGHALQDGVAALVLAAAGRAADATGRAWRQEPAGRALLAEAEAGGTSLEVPSPGLAERAEEEVAAWRRDVVGLVAAEGGQRRTAAKALSYGVNGTGLVVMMGVFLHTGGLTGAEVAVAGGTSAVGQKVLEAVFGDAALRALVKRARERLDARVTGLLAAERARGEELLAAAAPEDGVVEDLRAVRSTLERARRATVLPEVIVPPGPDAGDPPPRPASSPARAAHAASATAGTPDAASGPAADAAAEQGGPS